MCIRAHDNCVVPHKLWFWGAKKKKNNVLHITSFHSRQDRQCQRHKEKGEKRKDISWVPFYKHIAHCMYCLSA